MGCLVLSVPVVLRNLVVYVAQIDPQATSNVSGICRGIHSATSDSMSVTTSRDLCFVATTDA